MPSRRSPLLADSIRLEEKLGMTELSIQDQNEKWHSFWFLPRRFDEFSDIVAAFNARDEACRGLLVGASSRPEGASPQIEKLVSLADLLSSRSGTKAGSGFAVYAETERNVAYLCLRESARREATLSLDREQLARLVHLLHEALQAIAPIAPPKH